MIKDLVLCSKEVKFEKDGKTYDFKAYYVIINGIELSLRPADNTVKQVLENYYKEGEK